MTVSNRLTRLFGQESRKRLAIFVTAGFPGPEDTVPICSALEEAGADIIELGFPFSDSLVDGPTIQAANERSLRGGMTLAKFFQQAAEVRQKVSLPLVVMSCINPLLQYGVERFCETCAKIGVDGAIIADLPVEEYRDRYRAAFESCGISNICLITAHSSEERLRMIDEVSSGFLYAVSSDATTGSKLAVDEGRFRYFERLGGMGLKNPLMVGFGISDRESFLQASRHASGGIIGSAFLRALLEGGDQRSRVLSFVESVKGPE